MLLSTNRFTWYVSLGVLVIGTALTYVMFYIVSSEETARISSEFSILSRQLGQQTSDRVATVLDDLMYANFHVERRNCTLTRESFHRFSNLTLSALPFLQAQEWIPRIEHSTREEIEQETSLFLGEPRTFRDILPNGTLVPSKPSQVYYPVRFVFPLEGNRAAVLLNLASNPSRNITLELARVTGRPTVSEPVRLVQERGDQFGILIFSPTLPFVGFNLFVIRLGDFLSDSTVIQRTNTVLRDIEICLLLRGESITKVVIDENGEATVRPTGERCDGNFRSVQPLQIANIAWDLEHLARPRFSENRRTNSLWIVVSLSGGFSLMCSVLVFFVSHLKFLQDLGSTLEKERRRARFQFVNYIFHEIRVPMNAVYAILQHLGSEAMSSVQSKLIHMAKASCNRAISVMGNVLDLEKMEETVLDINPTWMPLSEIFSLSVWTYSELAESKGISLKHESDLRDAEVFIDGMRLSQALDNYLSNAVKYSDTGKTVTLHTKFSEQDCTLHVEVTDEGRGLPNDEDYGKLFKRYADIKKIASAQGTGLGLSVVKAIIEQHNGTVFGRKREPHGSVFGFSIPSVRWRTVQRRKMFRGRETQRDEKKSLLPEKMLSMLIVDDDVVTRKIMRRMFEKQGFLCTLAEDGKIAVAKAAEQEFDVVIMDKTMPNMDGLQATKLIKSQVEKIVVIGLSGNTILTERDAFLNAGADAWIAKPFQMNDILNKIQDLIQKRANA